MSLLETWMVGFGVLAFGVAVFIFSYHYVQMGLDWLRFQSLGTRDYIVEKCNLMFIDVTPNRVLVWLIAASVGPFLLIFFLFLPNVVPGLVFGVAGAVAGWKLPKPFINYLFRRRIDKFNLQMVDGLGLMANAMRSGLSVVQAMGIVSEQMPNPMSQEFNLILSQNKVGVSIEEAFTNLSKRVNCEDVEMFVTSVNILKETGGNLAETFDTIVFVIRERLRVESKIKALTAQGFIQGIILLSVPPILGIYFAVSEPGFMDPLFSHPLGWAILAGIIGLEITAYVVVKKMIAIDV
ncbi:MAG: type II secretion system F family protein [Bdellovibrionota bacterium]